ncbi:pumilio homolog 23-like [Zingiber officinale]|uniref:pumilio homolog 23-like n=1 Tax=Zingiber officinale TaxID=94328 RepID=UPI001C4B1E9E|nr:pumilio homolog 23-like [Zingiber officinale]
MGEEKSLTKHLKKKAKKNKNHRKDHLDHSKKSSSSHGSRKRNKDPKQRRGSSNAPKGSNTEEVSFNVKSRTPILRKPIDPETTKYFAEVANLFHSNEVDLEDLPTICNNALEETRGKEVELATDMTISHTIQNLLEGCDMDRLCGFLRNSAKGFVSIVTDKFGSHVAETALRSLVKHMDEEGSYAYADEILSKLCQVVILDVVSVMCSRYGSHVLRSLLCLSKGVPLNSFEEFHVAKLQDSLAKRLNNRPIQSGGSNSQNSQYAFPSLFKFLVSEMVNHAKDEIKTLRVNEHSSFVLQTVLKLSVGDDQALSHAISTVLGCDIKDIAEGRIVSNSQKEEIMDLLEDTASSHLLEVIIEVAPETLYNVLLTEVFKDSLFVMSSHKYGNFVVQTLVSSARTKDQMELIWKELGSKFNELLKLGKPGVVALMLAASERLQTHLQECCQALRAAVILDSESPSCIVPRLLFLENYFKDKSSWKWPADNKMHVLGCIMLQIIFRHPKQPIQPYVTSLASMEPAHIFQTAKDSGGGHVIEAFLSSDVSLRLKHKVVTKLRDHYGELAMSSSGSFTVEKCFSSGNMTLKETIAEEILAVQPELSKTKHGPYLLKKLDIDGFASRPEQWKKKQESKENAYKEFHALFGSKSEPDEQNNKAPAFAKSPKKQLKRHEKVGRDVGNVTTNSVSEFPGLNKSKTELGYPSKETSRKRSLEEAFMRNETGKRKSVATDLADLAAKSSLSAEEIQQLFKPSMTNDNKRYDNAKLPLLKKQKW